tara:strand:- start:1476 stop:2288 length:813 start_codon:yes stop_codon:yes gene_type:complete
MNYEIIYLILLMLVSGAIAGFVAGLFGIGGGIILMPALMYGFDQMEYSRIFTTHLSIGTSLAIITPTTAFSAWTYYKHGSGNLTTLSKLAIPAACGAFFGSWLAGGLSGNVLRFIFAVLIMLIALNLFKKNHFVFGHKLPSSYITWTAIGMIGMFSAMMGISGGVFFTTFLVAYGFSLLNAIGTSVALGLTVSLPATVGYIVSGLGSASLPPFSFGYISLVGFVCIIPMTLFMVPKGAKLAHNIDKLILKRLLAVFMMLMSIRVFYTIYN